MDKQHVSYEDAGDHRGESAFPRLARTYSWGKFVSPDRAAHVVRKYVSRPYSYKQKQDQGDSIRTLSDMNQRHQRPDNVWKYKGVHCAMHEPTLQICVRHGNGHDDEWGRQHHDCRQVQ